MNYGLIGEKLSHSFSPEIHGKIGNYPYILKELSKDELRGFILDRDFKGINVTIPYKTEVMRYLDVIDPEAEKIGAVNTVVNNNGILHGYNTDITGITELIKRVCGDKLSGKALILGTGGTSLTAHRALTNLGLKEIYRVSRTEKDSVITYNKALSLHTDASYIINTTPVGMYPNTDACPIDISAFKSLKGIVDVIFNPLSTVLIRTARKTGVPAEGGLYMLVSQAVKASSLFFERDFDPSLTDKVYKEILSQKQNLVLIGMPSCGKTSVGCELSKLTGKEFVDTDELIVKKAGMEIPEIFEKYGEKHFRDLEGQVIKEVSDKCSLIISTGGGAVLREENVDALRANGRIIFLDRPLDMLISTPDRPLSSSTDALKARYDERYPIYLSSCDIKVPSVKAPSEVAKEIISNENNY